MTRLLVSSFSMVVGLASLVATTFGQGDNETCTAAGCPHEAEDQVSALQVTRNRQDDLLPFHKCPPRPLNFGCKAVQSIVNAVETTGTISHAFANDQKTIDSILSDKLVHWNDKMNDCVPAKPKFLPLQDCSAWSLIKTGFVPVVYNYPTNYYMMHPVGLMAKLSPSVNDLVTRRHVVDGDTWQRNQWGMHVNKDGTAGPVVEEWEKKCDHWEQETKQPVMDTQVHCVEETQYKNGCNVKDKRFEVAVGKHGRDWPKIYMYDQNGKIAFNQVNTMNRQCEFFDESLFEGALRAFYAEVGKLTVMNPISFGYPYPKGRNTPQWGSLYLESELNIQQKGAQLVSELKPDMLAIVVTSTPCAKQVEVMSDTDPAAFCTDLQAGGKSEQEVIEDSMKAACIVQKQLLQQNQIKVPVVDAKYLTNSMTQASWAHWASKRACECTQFCEIDCKDFV